MKRFLFAITFVLLINSFILAQEMNGEWVSISRIRGGEQQYGSATEAVIKDGKFNTVREGETRELGNISEDTKNTPNQYSVEMTGSVPDSGKSFNGIFMVSADTMVTCVNPVADGQRPAEFKSTKENGNILVVWMRKSAAEKMGYLPASNPKSEEKSK